METVRFNTVVDQDRVIHAPEGVTLPKGAVQVIVTPVTKPTTSESDPLSGTRSWLLAFAADAEQAAPSLPPDMAEHHDHYAHGKPLP